MMKKKTQRLCEDVDIHHQHKPKHSVIVAIVTIFQLLLVCLTTYLLVELHNLKESVAKQQITISHLQGLLLTSDQFSPHVKLNSASTNQMEKIDSLRIRRGASQVTPTSSTGDSFEGKTNDRLSILETIVQKQHPQWSSVHMYTSKSKFLSNLNDTQINKLLNNEELQVHGGHYKKDKGYIPEGKKLKVWQKHNWDDNMSYMPRFADISNLWENGTVLIQQPGLYLIYAQVTFQTSALHQSISIHDSVKDKSLATCIVSERFNIDEHKKVTDDPSVYLPCSVTTVQYLKNNTHLSIQSLYEGRRILLRESFTYWGVTQLWRE